ncbi:MAG: hypothetical protein NBV68_04100 [Erythrobacter sp.]|uniref:hypothetical protein n=1 Tax=Erythrobacter sp. TaxID=1042 RepID=UPI0025D71E24|nr:hypothetical protein [Erythrobacter sp.]MCL9998539.1 hypothetical protein [Erythrobacter sp.]
MLAQPVFAQTAPEPAPAPAPETEILVQTQRRDAEKAVQTLARQVTGRLPPDRPIARFHEPLCLAVAGINRAYLDSFAGRIIENAKLADVPMARGDCKANALVIFTGNTREELAQARKKQRWIFGNLGPSALDALLKSRDPAFAWRSTEILGTNGMLVQYDDREVPQNRTIEMAGRLKQPIMIGVTGAVVIIDRDATKGMTAQQLADYATLRLLAPTTEVRELIPGAPATIMTLFLDPAGAPAELTDFDLALLRNTYAIAGNVPASNVYGRIANDLVRDR